MEKKLIRGKWITSWERDLDRQDVHWRHNVEMSVSSPPWVNVITFLLIRTGVSSLLFETFQLISLLSLYNKLPPYSELLLMDDLLLRHFRLLSISFKTFTFLSVSFFISQSFKIGLPSLFEWVQRPPEAKFSHTESISFPYLLYTKKNNRFCTDWCLLSSVVEGLSAFNP